MATTGFKLPGFRAYVNRVKNVTAQKAADIIVEELQEAGPAWSGEFRNAWKIVPGTNKRIPASRQSSYDNKERAEFRFKPPETQEQIKAEPLKGRGDNGYTIGNQMEYRDIAMDLVPSGNGKYRGDREGKTAPKDWYVKFAEGGRLRQILEEATLEAQKDPTIRGFPQKGRLPKE